MNARIDLHRMRNPQLDAPLSPKALDARRIEALFTEIGERLNARGVVAEFAVFGGSALALTFDFRDATMDVDYMPVSEDLTDLREVAAEMAQEKGLASDWLNDAVAMFKSEHARHEWFGDFPPDKPGLRVFVALPTYLLAMKIMAMRSSLETNDVRDVWYLLDELDVRDVSHAMEIVARYYPNGKFPARNALVLEDIFSAKQRGREYSKELGW